MADQTVPDRPVFDIDRLMAEDREPGDVITSTDGRTWLRVVNGSDGPCAAESSDGVLTVWDEAALFDAVFHLLEQHTG